MILDLKILNRQIGFKLISRKNKYREVIGYTNRCTDGKYILTLDYDNMRLDFIQNEIIRLQEDYGLGDFYIIKSSKESYHAVCLDKMNYHDFLDILMSTSVDYNYIRVPINSGQKLWVLRLTKKDIKPEVVEIVKSPYQQNEKSFAHLNLLHKILKIDIPEEIKGFDLKKEIVLARYKT